MYTQHRDLLGIEVCAVHAYAHVVGVRLRLRRHINKIQALGVYYMAPSVMLYFL